MVEIQPGLTVGEPAANFKLAIDEIKPIMINGLAAKWHMDLRDDERVSPFPPVRGPGATTSSLVSGWYWGTLQPARNDDFPRIPHKTVCRSLKTIFRRDSPAAALTVTAGRYLNPTNHPLPPAR